MANEIAVSGKSEAEINAFIDKIIDAMAQHREVRPRSADSDAARTDQAQDQGRRRLQARHGRASTRRSAASASSSAYALWRARKKTRAAIWSSPRRPAARPA